MSARAGTPLRAGRAGSRAPRDAATLLVQAWDDGLRWAYASDASRGAAYVGGRDDHALFAGPRPTRVLVANGAGERAASTLATRFRAEWDLAPEFVVPQARAAGLTCAQPHEVGADRWLAMIGARRRGAGEAFAVVTCGPVLAVDLVDATGRHRGGYVVPGVRQMRDALYARTGSLANLAALAAPATDGLFGVNTAGGIEQGARFALASLVERAVRELERLAGAPPRVLLTGPVLAELRPLLPSPVLAVDELVLDGLGALVADTAT